MDIRKFLKKPSGNDTRSPSASRRLGSSASTAASASASASASTASQRTPSSRRSINGAASASGDTPVPTSSKRPRHKRASSAKTDGSSAGYGASAGRGAGDDAEGGGAPPPAKKGRWVPRTDDPPNRGNKPLPVGAPDCLAGHVFVISGVLDSLLREECQDLCKQYGARVVSAVSGKVTHGIMGVEPGASKLTKLKKNKTPLIDEDELFRIINASGPKDTPKSEEKGEDVVMIEEEDVKEEEAINEEEVDDEDEIVPVRRGGRKKASHAFREATQAPAADVAKKAKGKSAPLAALGNAASTNASGSKDTPKSEEKGEDVVMIEEDEAVNEEEVDDEDKIVPIRRGGRKKATQAPAADVSKKAKGKSAPLAALGSAASTLWVDKYRPTKSEDLVGNNKLIKDLRSWLDNWKDLFLRGDGHSLKQKDRGDSAFAAVLLVGPPGVGKTTAAHTVCQEAGFEPHEFNASDVRNKAGVQALAETVMMANTLSKYLSFCGSDARKRGAVKYPHGQVLIMDEVDGMSGGDRGGSQELIRMIKKTKVPIICIANDDSSSNIRSLAGNCYRLRFRKVTTVQVTKRLVEIAMREGFRAVQDQTLGKLAEGCNGDIRQMINLMQTWRVASPSLSYVQVKERLEVEGKTLMQKSVFELAKSFFQPGIDGSANSLSVRTDSYFADSDLMPLFVQENYTSTVGAGQSLDALADAAESIAEGDLCNSMVRQGQRWELMPAGAILSAIRPGCLLAGGLGSQPMFPSFLGNLSKGNKWKRIVHGLEMKVKATRTTTGSTRAFRLDYIPALTTCMAIPMIRDGVDGVSEVIERLEAYYLEKDPDWDEIMDAGVFARGQSPLENIPTAVKTALTREYNSGVHARSSVTGTRVGVKGADGSVVAALVKKEEREAMGVLDEVAEEVEVGDEEAGEDEVMKEFGAKKGRGGKGKGRGAKGRGASSRSAGSSASRSSRAGSSGRGGRGRGRKSR